MEKWHSYVHTSLDLLGRYDGTMPLHHFLRNHFRQHKKFGSRDRRWIKELCFAWFRSGNLYHELQPIQRLLWSFYLVNNAPSHLLSAVMASGGEEFATLDYSLSLAAKIDLSISVHSGVQLANRFVFGELVSPKLNLPVYTEGLMRQPLVWLRVNKKYLTQVTNELSAAEIEYKIHPQFPLALSLSQGVSLENTPIVEKGWAEVQDLSSQKTALLMKALPGEKWYDACAASGGKSLLLLDKEPGIHLTVSDSRESVLENLHERFQRNRVLSYTAIVRDLTARQDDLTSDEFFDGIIADVPCSGSGTWARTPEQMAFFTQEKLRTYVSLQNVITANLARRLKKGGKLVYITCSVFKQENEERVEALMRNSGFYLKRMELFEGAAYSADTLFAALLIKK